MRESLTVLMLSTDPRVLGGMTTMAAMIMAHTKHCQFTLLPLGNVNDRETSIQRLKRLFTAPHRVARAARTVDVVHLNTPFNVKGLIRDGLVLFALRHRRENILLYFHGWHAATAKAIARFYPLRKLFLWLTSSIPQILVLAPEFKQALIDIGIPADRITVTRTMFDGSLLREAVVTHRTDRRRILFMSRFVREKGIYELLDAFARIAADYPDTDLILAGDGPEYTNLRAAAAKHSTLANRIHFPGYVTGSEKASLLLACDIYALPTYYPEGMPVALLEAMGAGKPLLTAKAGGIEQIISAENGIVLESVTTENVTNALRQLLNNPDECMRIGKHNAEYAWRHFEANAVTQEIEIWYRQLAAR